MSRGSCLVLSTICISLGVAAPVPALAQQKIWGQRTELLPDDLGQSDEYGTSVAVDGSLAIVGTPWQEQAGVSNDAGAAYVYAKSANGWTLETKLLPTGNLFQPAFGHAVDISGNTAIVGAYAQDTYVGSAFLFARSNGTWSLQQKLTETASYAQQRYGYSVTISGDTAVVGARQTHVNGLIDAGSVYVYTRSNGVWSLQKQLLSPSPDNAQLFGSSVDISGDTLVVGAWYMPDVSGPRGVVSAAYVFSRSAGVWDAGKQLVPGDSAPNDEFGTSVAVSGNTIVVGAQQRNSYFYGPGAAYVFVRGAQGWSQQQKLTASDGQLGDTFGHSVAIDANSVIVGAWSHYHPVAGAAYAFTRAGSVWAELQEMSIVDSAFDDAGFGASVSISGTNIVVGMPYQYYSFYQAGTAYTYALANTDGGACNVGTDCASGACVDGVCCNEGCDPCGVCSVAAGATTDGVCKPKPKGAPCRSAAGVCDSPEACDGTSKACPPDALALSSTVCRAAAGDCDIAELCTGFSVDCPGDGVQGQGSVCRTAAGSCDLDEQCNGVDKICPTNVVAPLGTVCRSASGACDIEELCDGADAACPADILQTPGTICRAAAGPCDIGETCTGTAQCPSDAFAAGVECRPAAGACDVAELCDGASAACPFDSPAPGGSECRPAAGACDRAEVCDGTTVVCPDDDLAPPTEICRAGVDVCDAPELCTGASAACPADAAVPAGTSCRAARDACDVEETCDGTSVACRADVHSADGTPCTGGSCLSGVCTRSGTPSGSSGGTAGTASDAGVPAGTGGAGGPSVSGSGGAAGSSVSGTRGGAGGSSAGDPAGSAGETIVSSDAGAGNAATEGGCGCRFARAEPAPPWPALAALMSLALRRRKSARVRGGATPSRALEKFFSHDRFTRDAP